MSLSLLASAHALPASQSAALSPAGSALVRGLWTADETKVNLRNATSFLLQSKQAAAGQCWMWSDPHVETLGGDVARRVARRRRRERHRGDRRVRRVAARARNLDCQHGS